MRLNQLCTIVLVFVTITACSKGPGSSTATVTSTSSLNPTPASYTPRVGIGISTNSRTCIVMHNGDLTTGAAITLISPIAPVTFTQATIANVTQQACPITQNVDTTVSNYNVTPQGPLQKLSPMIVVLGNPAVTVNSNNVAQTDLDQNGQTETFRACSADNGIHLTVWKGAPLQGTLLWHGYYYEASNPGIGPACTPAEMPAQ